MGSPCKTIQRCRPSAWCLSWRQPALQQTCLWICHKALQWIKGFAGTPLDMLLQHQHITLSRATVMLRAELVPFTLLSKPTPRQTSSGEFVTVQEPNMADDSLLYIHIYTMYIYIHIYT